MMITTRALAVSVAVFLVGASGGSLEDLNPANDLPTGSAAGFTDAAGVAIHLTYTDTAYGNNYYPRIRDHLIDLGIHHVRDGLIDKPSNLYYAHIKELTQHGIHFDLVAPIDASVDLIRAYPKRVPGAIEAYEGPNEYDLQRVPGWPAALAATQHRLYSAVRNDAELRGIMVIGPSLTTQDAALALGDISPLMDCGTVHIYVAGRNPGTRGWGSTDKLGTYGSLHYDIALAAITAPEKPLCVTESGYPNDMRDTGAVPTSVAARYIPRILLENWNLGIARTYLYELVDVGKNGDANYGLLDKSGDPKPAYFAVKNLLATVDAVGTAHGFTELHCNFRGGSDAQATLLAGSRGRFMLAAWREVPSWSAIDRQPLTVEPKSATIACDHVLTDDAARSIGDDGTLGPNIALSSGRAVEFSISDHVTLLSFRVGANP